MILEDFTLFILIFRQPFYDLIGQYKFALSMENAICEGYMTEKLFRPLESGYVLCMNIDEIITYCVNVFIDVGLRVFVSMHVCIYACMFLILMYAFICTLFKLQLVSQGCTGLSRGPKCTWLCSWTFHNSNWWLRGCK